MKFIAYEVREDEIPFFEQLSKNLGIEVNLVNDVLHEGNVELARGYDGVTVLGRSEVNAVVLDSLKELGIKYVTARTIGYNHMDVKYANKIGIKMGNSGYAPNGVADYTVMLMLMCLRHYKQAMFRGNVNDYSLVGLKGKEMRSLTIGVIGAGKIGKTVIQNLQGFGSKVIVHSEFIDDSIKDMATYVDLDTLYKESDIITVHVPLLDSTYRMINRMAIDKMKEGVILINTARGELMDIQDLIYGIETMKIGALGLDVFEKEEGIYHKDRRTDIIRNRDMAYLRQFPNVVMTQHIAFYTDEAVESMVECALNGLVQFNRNGESDYEIKLKY